MKRFLAVCFLALFLAGCGSALVDVGDADRATKLDIDGKYVLIGED